MLTVFANMLINSEERFEHLKDSFESFDTVSDDWLINIGGKERDRVIVFLKERLGDKATFFELLDDDRGWAVNSLDMVRHAKHPYVLFWLEDHMNIAPQSYLREVVEEMEKHDADYLQHSWWMNGAYKRYFDPFDMQRGTSIDTVTIGYEEWKKWRDAGEVVQLISLLGIFEKNFLIKLLQYDRYMLPLSVRPLLFRGMTLLQRLGVPLNQKVWFHHINRLLRFKIRRQPKETPHDFEKEPSRYDVLPIRTSVAHREIFACMDDDDDPSHRSSLMTRGLYPIRDRLISWDGALPQKHARRITSLENGAAICEAYCYFSAKGVRHVLSREYIRVIRGRVRISVKDETIELAEGEGAAFFTNIPHEIVALEDAEIERFTPDVGLAPHYLET